ncbi:MAG TPA: ATP-grasp domain-containing protein [Candidatus Saccharimonadales bacterium]
MKRILIFSSAEEDYAVRLNDDFVAELNKRTSDEVHIEWHNYHDIRLVFGSDKLEAYIQSTDTPLSALQFVYFKSYFRYSEQAASVAAYLSSVHVPFVCSELTQYMPMTKLTQFTRLALDGAPIAPTIYLDRGIFAESYSYLTRELGSPFIFKSTDGSGGRENYLVHDKSELQGALRENPELQFVAQRFIANESDLRVLIVDRTIQLIIKRTRVDGSHLNNTSQGGHADLLPLEQLSPEHQNLALHAAALMNREIAGVDLMFEVGTGQPYILEVNASPQIGSGAFTDEKLKIYSNYFENVLK